MPSSVVRVLRIVHFPRVTARSISACAWSLADRPSSAAGLVPDTLVALFRSPDRCPAMAGRVAGIVLRSTLTRSASHAELSGAIGQFVVYFPSIAAHEIGERLRFPKTAIGRAKSRAETPIWLQVTAYCTTRSPSARGALGVEKLRSPETPTSAGQIGTATALSA